jgi:hypothetical protein
MVASYHQDRYARSPGNRFRVREPEGSIPDQRFCEGVGKESHWLNRERQVR